MLKSWLLDLGSARQLGLRTTGHAARGLAGPPGPSPTNVHLKPGEAHARRNDEGRSANGFYVTELIGHGANIVTGDYSRGASGFWIENGEIAYPVSEITIAGKLADIFPKLTPANDLELPQRHQRALLPRARNDPWRTLSFCRRRRCAKRASSPALCFSRSIKGWTKSDGSPVTEADLAVDKALKATPARRAAGLRLALGGNARQRRAPDAPPCVDRRSDRRHARFRAGRR